MYASGWSVGPDTGCEQRGVLQREISPSGAVVAVVRESVCSDGWLTTVVIATVELSHPASSQAGVRVLVVDTGGRVDQQPMIGWRAMDVLAIRVSNGFGVRLLPHAFGTVGIEVTLDRPRTGASGETLDRDLLREMGD